MQNFLSYNEKYCILNCTEDFEYFDNRTWNYANCDDYISNYNKICLDFCKRIIQLINNIMLNKLCANENLWSLYKQITNNNIYYTDKSF